MLAGIATLLLLFSCKKDELPPEQALDSTWNIIQTRIWDQNCVICHTAGNTFARQSDLVLDADVAYSQLVGRKPHNQAALNDGLLLVGTQGLESLYTSFLWEKINVEDQEHFYEDHPEYGELMPLSGRPLTNGELAFIRKWIIEGAPEKGMVADPALLEDSSRYEAPPTAFEPLEIPASGYQLHLGPFEVAPHYEREFFYYQPLHNAQAAYVNRVQIRMRPGSHHFILYDFLPGANLPPQESFRDLRNLNGEYLLSTIVTLEDQRFVFGTQWREMDYQFPPGVALKVRANSGFDLNAHYVNRSDTARVGEVFTNLHTIPASEVQHVAKNLFLSHEDFRLPPGKSTTVERVFRFNERRHIFLLTSHAHEHMTAFRIYISGGPRNGELVFFANDWEHPPLLQFDPPLTIEAGQGLKAVATYYNDTPNTLEYGLLSEDEMMIIFGAYY
ncbi:MAG: hypothetical protein D6730_13305 [Bacteroidetes bacterium]|nr:MAG: hypothetical protein D6730_13305 [Bacteroidota bacterium]